MVAPYLGGGLSASKCKGGKRKKAVFAVPLTYATPPPLVHFTTTAEISPETRLFC